MSTYCVLNPSSEKCSSTIELSLCGINILMNTSNISTYSDVVIFLIGEIYELQKWITILQLPLKTTAEDVIIHLYKTYGIEYTLQVLDGVFSFLLFDYYYENIISKVYIVKDSFGIIPFYCFTNNKTILFTNSNIIPDTYTEHAVYTGSYTVYELGYKVNAEWIVSPIKNRSYFVLPNSVITSPIDKFSVSLHHLSKCIKSAILHMGSNVITNQVADVVVEKLFIQIDCSLDEQHDIHIYDEVNKTLIHFSPMNFFILPDGFESMFDYDYKIRNKLQLSVFESNKKYPFYDKTFVQFYFSIPLQMRYTHHKELFSIDKK